MKRIPIVETERLILRPVQKEDAQAIYDYSVDPLVTKYVTYNTYTSMNDAYWALENLFLNRSEKGLIEAYAIVLKSTGKMIGTCDGGSIHFGDTIEIGYVMHRDYWGNGYMTEAVHKLCQVLFDTMDIRRIEVSHHPDNVGSRRVIEKLGFTLEGVRRQLADCGDGYRDFPFYSLLKGELE